MIGQWKCPNCGGYHKMDEVCPMQLSGVDASDKENNKRR